jgi:hypothetical protein
LLVLDFSFISVCGSDIAKPSSNASIPG